MRQSGGHMSGVLETQGLSVSFGGVTRLVDVDLEVTQGKLVGLIGPNGAGKTTSIDAITGFARLPTAASCFDGEDITALRAARARAPRSRADLAEHRALRRPHGRGEPAAVAQPAAWACGQGGRRPLLPVGDAARRRRLGARAVSASTDVADRDAERAVAGPAQARRRRPRARRSSRGSCCMDEPAAGLDTDESAELGRQLRAASSTRHVDAARRPRHGPRARRQRLGRRARVRQGHRARQARARSAATRR